ncbi:MAG: phosphoheptose isomerase [Bacteroidetes bacterium]|nr:phosphoheptose isomerase [Bacteroidota bacterium]
MVQQTKVEIFERIQTELKAEGFNIDKSDFTRPWGGFFVIDENQADQFIEKFFPTYKKESLMLGNKLSPKILVVAPEQRLSWQYHFRRAEIWRVVEGEVGVVISDTDEETKLGTYEPGELIVLSKGQRHRLVGLNDWGVIAEIWQHTDTEHPSDEEDIVRLQDDYGR